jgi:hypothetical protein
LCIWKRRLSFFMNDDPQIAQTCDDPSFKWKFDITGTGFSIRNADEYGRWCR